jgi:hypothetical protein
MIGLQAAPDKKCTTENEIYIFRRTFFLFSDQTTDQTSI